MQKTECETCAWFRAALPQAIEMLPDEPDREVELFVIGCECKKDEKTK